MAASEGYTKILQVSLKWDTDVNATTIIITFVVFLSYNDRNESFKLFTLGPSTVSSFDYLREACVLGGHDTTIRSGPSPEARLIVVGEQHRIALFRVNKVIQ